jgi:hypothetical protein
MKKRGIFFSVDALMALIIIFLSILVIYPTINYVPEKSYLQEDILNVISSINVGEIEDPYIEQLILDGKIDNLNKSVLEQIGEFYITNITLAKSFSEFIFENIDERENIGIWYGDDLIYSKNETSFETAKSITVERQIISGIEKGKNTTGFVAKAWLRKIDSKRNMLFVRGDLMCGGWRDYSWGPYCGLLENTATYKVIIPENATIENATWLVEGSWTPQYSTLVINGNQIFAGSISFYRIFDITSNLVAGENNVTITGNIGADDGASHIVVDYSISDMNTFEHNKIFPFAELLSRNILHYEKSLFVPTEISEIDVYLNSTHEVSLSFRKGAQTFVIGQKNPTNNLVNFSDSEIKSVLNSNGVQYSDLSNEYFFFTLDIGENHVGADAVLGENSYVYINSSEIELPYGSIDINQEIPVVSYSDHVTHTFYRNLLWEFYLPVNAIPILADWQFGWFLTSTTSQLATGNSNVVYNSPPDDFISAFSRFGYTPTKAIGLFNEGKNNFSLNFGNGYSVSNEASYGYILYFIKNYVNYGDALEKAKGGTRNLVFEDNTTRNLFIGNPSDTWDPEIDAIDDAVERLLSQLDSNNNSKIDLILDDESFDMDSLDISGVPYMWSTEVQVRKWK